jgi:L-serine dehydratase
LLDRTATVHAELFGSLGATGHGHGSDKAVLLGLEGEDPETVDTHAVGSRVDRIRETRSVRLLGTHEIAFDPDQHLVMHRRKTLPYHPNGMTFSAEDATRSVLRSRTYYSVGGGFVVDENAAAGDRIVPDTTELPFPFSTGAELLDRCRDSGQSIAGVMLANELAWRSEEEIRAGRTRCTRSSARIRGRSIR